MAYAKKNNNSVSCEVIDTLATFKVTDKKEIRITIAKWGDHEAKVDVRNWEVWSSDGQFHPTHNGVTMKDLDTCKGIAKVLEGLTVEPTNYKPEKAEQKAEKKETAKKGTVKKGTTNKGTAKKAETETVAADVVAEEAKPVRRKRKTPDEIAEEKLNKLLDGMTARELYEKLNK